MEKKSNYEIALEVWRGEWGAEPQRSLRLAKAGYDPEVIQDLVNTFSPADLIELIKGLKPAGRVLNVDLDLDKYDAIQVNFK